MKIGFRTIVTAGLTAGSLGLGAQAVSAMPAFDTRAEPPAASTALPAEKVYCNYYGCRHRYYGGGYYRPYYNGYRPYGYYRPYYGPRIGVGIGGVGLGLF